METLFKSGKYTLVLERIGFNYFRLDNGFFIDSPLYMPHNDSVTFDRPERFPKAIKAKVWRILRNFHKYGQATKPKIK